MSELQNIDERVSRVQDRIRAACARAGRDPESVQLVAVSKKQPPEKIRAAAEAGLRVFGESRVQEAGIKIPECPGSLEWHMIGHLQTNKVKPAVHLFDVIHSVDSRKLLEAINQACDTEGRFLKVLLQVNVSGESVKFGLPPGILNALLERASDLNRLEVVGLMTIPPFHADPEKARPHFVALRELRDQAREATGFSLDELSMGMSHDFEVAIEEGATMIRVGTDIFGERENQKS